MEIIINTTLAQILSGTAVLVILLGVFQWLITKWIGARIEKSIQHEYDKKIEDYRFQHLQRQKAETIARLFAKWIKYRGNEEEYLEKDQLIDFYEELNQMSFEISLWIKDEVLLTDIMARLNLKEGAKEVRELVGEIRKLILNDSENNFDAQDIILWPNNEIEKRLFGAPKKEKSK